eukprot:9499718-Pyramimonas_sp.AAC.1
MPGVDMRDARIQAAVQAAGELQREADRLARLDADELELEAALMTAAAEYLAVDLELEEEERRRAAEQPTPGGAWQAAADGAAYGRWMARNGRVEEAEACAFGPARLAYDQEMRMMEHERNLAWLDSLRGER